MKILTPEQKMVKAEKRIKELLDSEDLKRLPEQVNDQIAQFYEQKSANRMETASLIFSYSSDAKKKQSTEVSKEYADYGEVVAASYYAMYYVVHAYLAKKYAMKLREETRGVHAITHHLILCYLVKTNQLATHLYEEYKKTMESTAQIQKISIDDFQEEAFGYAKKYDESRAARERGTYNVTKSVEEHHAKQAMDVAKEFIGTVRELMVTR